MHVPACLLLSATFGRRQLDGGHPLSPAYPDKCVHSRMDPVMTSGALPGLEDRPDLIAHASLQAATQSPATRGKLRTYLGIAPGVGKTYAMLRDGRAVRRAGVDAVVAYRERHGRPATAAQLGDLEVLPARTVTYRGASFDELDVSAVLDRRPGLPLVGELAHATHPGEGRAKRWQAV